jgi:small-conductance mechanosensitive channel
MKSPQRKRKVVRKGLAGAAWTVLLAIGAGSLCGDAPAELGRDAVLNHLNAVITWYRDATTKVQAAGLPSDAIYQDNAQGIGEEAVRLAFQSARAEAALISENKNHGGSSAAPSDQTGQPQNLSQTAARVAAETEDTQTKLDAVNKQLATATRSKKQDLLTQRDALQGQLTLDKAMEDSIQKMETFVETATESGGKGLEGSINELAKSVPEILGVQPVQLEKNQPEKKTTTPVKPTTSQTASSEPSGLIGQSLALFGQMSSMHEIDQMLDETASLRDTAERLRKPLRDNLTATIQRGRDLANPPTPPANPSAQQAPGPAKTQQPESTTKEYQDLTNQFKQLAAATLPLSQEIVVIDEGRSNFLAWRRSIARESGRAFRALAMRVLGIGLALGGVVVLSEIWRRLTFRYVKDPRRRRQFLLIRRVVTGFLTGVVLIMGFVSEFSSLATFAGFVTAGIAVGLQAVLLSVAAYFFVVGRYGIRVGDRISVAGVTGDVIDIGLVRLYLMELAGTGIDLYPTGRVIVFSNSVLFQAGTPLFKQIPGTEYAWHEVAVSLGPESNYKLVQEKLFAAVHSVYEQYRAGLESQLGNIEQRIEVQLKAPIPEAKLQFADAGLEFVVRYPVDIRKATEIDDKTTRAVLDAFEHEHDLKASVSGPPKIRAAIKG